MVCDAHSLAHRKPENLNVIGVPTTRLRALMLDHRVAQGVDDLQDGVAGGGVDARF